MSLVIELCAGFQVARMMLLEKLQMSSKPYIQLGASKINMDPCSLEIALSSERPERQMISRLPAAQWISDKSTASNIEKDYVRLFRVRGFAKLSIGSIYHILATII
jgi:hypothetical protein